jgi:hypothetical protein
MKNGASCEPGRRISMARKAVLRSKFQYRISSSHSDA